MMSSLLQIQNFTSLCLEVLCNLVLIFAGKNLVGWYVCAQVPKEGDLKDVNKREDHVRNFVT